MKYLHTMLRVKNLDASLKFWIDQLGFKETRRVESDNGRFTLCFVAPSDDQPPIELTYNWDDDEEYPISRYFGHVAFGVEDIYETCSKLIEKGVDILRPPRDGHMAFIKSPDGHSVELLQIGEPLPPKAPWTEMENKGSW